jgi:hypothetical protein
MEALFGTSEAERKAAQALLDALPKEVRTRDEEVAWTTECWLATRLPCDEDLAKSPIGKATLELLKANAPGAKKPDATVAPVASGPAAAEQPAPASPAVEPVNERLQKLAWPPAGKLLNTPPKDPADEQRNSIWPRYTAGRPTPPDTSLKPLAGEDFAANAPI